MTPAPDYSPDPTLTPQQHRIITLLAAGNNITQAAAAENLHRNTVANWRRTIPAFARELEFALREQRQYWHEQATRLAPQAIQAIEETLTDPKASPSLRFRAATLILKMLTDPQTKPTKGFPALSSETEARQGEFLQMHKDAQNAQEDLTPDPEEVFDIEESARISVLAQTCTKPQPIRVAPQPGRNQACPCGSGIKYKKCCISKAA